LLTSAGNGINATNRNSKLDLGATYSIANIVLGGSCAGQTHIMFDVKGRPMADNANLYAGLYTTACTITLTNEAGQTATIYVQPETGYVGATAGSDILYAGPGF
ncbi:MAG: hypothetical protein II923_06065, partial [Campylobacter sp.]|nr:hypothetical protein [Campylobacter sp.]